MNKKKILLFFPNPSLGNSRKFIPSDRIVPPMQYLFLASPLERQGYEVIIIDGRTVDYTTYRNLVKDAIFVGITSMTGPQIKEGISISKFIKKINKEVPIVWGGIHPTIFPIQTLSNRNIDIVVKNEGEETIVELANALSKKKYGALENIKGICYKIDGKIYENASRDYFVNLNEFPIPSWHLISNEKKYMFRFFTSRGCLYNCYFCYNKAYHHCKYRARDVGHVMKEIDYARSLFKFNSIQIGDDEFLLQKQRAKEIFDALEKRKIQLEWFMAKERSVSEDLLPYFLKTGCKEISMSIESGSERILKLINKRLSIKHLLDIKKELKKINIATSHSFMIGFPFETDIDLRQNVELAKKLKEIDLKTRMSAAIFVPYPGTNLFTYLKSRYDVKEPKKLEEWSQTDWYGEIHKDLRTWDKNFLFYKDFQIVFQNLFFANYPISKSTKSIFKKSKRIRNIFGV